MPSCCGKKTLTRNLRVSSPAPFAIRSCMSSHTSFQTSSAILAITNSIQIAYTSGSRAAENLPVPSASSHGVGHGYKWIVLVLISIKDIEQSSNHNCNLYFNFPNHFFEMFVLPLFKTTKVRFDILRNSFERWQPFVFVFVLRLSFP